MSIDQLAQKLEQQFSEDTGHQSPITDLANLIREHVPVQEQWQYEMLFQWIADRQAMKKWNNPYYSPPQNNSDLTLIFNIDGDWLMDRIRQIDPSIRVDRGLLTQRIQSAMLDHLSDEIDHAINLITTEEDNS